MSAALRPVAEMLTFSSMAFSTSYNVILYNTYSGRKYAIRLKVAVILATSKRQVFVHRERL